MKKKTSQSEAKRKAGDRTTHTEKRSERAQRAVAALVVAMIVVGVVEGKVEREREDTAVRGPRADGKQNERNKTMQRDTNARERE